MTNLGNSLRTLRIFYIFITILLIRSQYLYAQEINNDKIKESALVNSPTSSSEYIYSSLMFSDQEIDAIDRALYSYKNKKVFISGLNIDGAETKEEEFNNNKSYIYLGSIVYFSDDNWSVWIDNNKISSQYNSKDNEFYIRSISPNQANILWNISLSKWKILVGKEAQKNDVVVNDKNQVEINFTLKPNQSYILTDDMVIEGRGR